MKITSRQATLLKIAISSYLSEIDTTQTGGVELKQEYEKLYKLATDEVNRINVINSIKSTMNRYNINKNEL